MQQIGVLNRHVPQEAGRLWPGLFAVVVQEAGWPIAG
jgi:hypothetical protein